MVLYFMCSHFIYCGHMELAMQHQLCCLSMLPGIARFKAFETKQMACGKALEKSKQIRQGIPLEDEYIALKHEKSLVSMLNPFSEILQ